MKTKKVRTRVCALQCLKCRDIIFSRANYDYRTCTCGATSVDGGIGPILNVTGLKYKTLCKYISASKLDLYNDWNHRIDKFGLIKESKRSK